MALGLRLGVPNIFLPQQTIVHSVHRLHHLGPVFYSASRFFDYNGCTCSSQSPLSTQSRTFLVTRQIRSNHHSNHRHSNHPHSNHPHSNHNSDEEDKMVRRPRTSITICQREHLEDEFQKERYPTLAYIDKLSRRVHLPQYVIKVRRCEHT